MVLVLSLAGKLDDIRGGGCTDLAFVLLVAAMLLVLSAVKPLTFSMEDRAESPAAFSEADVTLGLRFWPARVP